MLDVFGCEAYRGAGRLNVLRHPLAHQLGYAPAELHLEARLDYLPAHDILRARPGRAVAREQLRPRSVVPQDHCGGAVGEESRRDEAGLGTVPPLERQTAQLDPDEEHLLFRVDSGVIQGPGEPPYPGSAAQPPD